MAERTNGTTPASTRGQYRANAPARARFIIVFDFNYLGTYVVR